MMRSILISGIQPSGRLHLGNYLGALKNFVELQNSGKYECYFFIADYHSLTAEDFNPKEKTEEINNLAADYLAAGLDPQKSTLFDWVSGLNPKKSTLFIQSQVPAHTELAWILNVLAPLGEMERMHQFKEKSGQSRTSTIANQLIDLASHTNSIANEISSRDEDVTAKNVYPMLEQLKKELGGINKDLEIRNSSNLGLFTYPILMAADILLYDAEFVPVGEDQLQHLELTRALARKFNSRFGKIFVEPKAILTKTPRVMSLDDPNKKMSKSRPTGCLFLDDSPDAIKEKVKKAVTDPGREIKYDEKNKPAISNLLSIYSAASGKSIKELEEKFKGKNYVEFKNSLADLLINYLKPFRGKKPDPESALSAGAKKANSIANKKLAQIKKQIGLLF